MGRKHTHIHYGGKQGQTTISSGDAAMSTPIRYSRLKFLSCLFHISLTTADRPQRARLPPVPPTATLPSCLWRLSLSKDLPISPRFSSYKFLSRCKFSTLTVRHVIVGFYLYYSGSQASAVRKPNTNCVFHKKDANSRLRTITGIVYVVIPTRPLGRRLYSIPNYTG